MKLKDISTSDKFEAIVALIILGVIGAIVAVVVFL